MLNLRLEFVSEQKYALILISDLYINILAIDVPNQRWQVSSSGHIIKLPLQIPARRSLHAMNLHVQSPTTKLEIEVLN